MKHYYLFILTFILLLSCNPINVRCTLEDVETYIMERPDSALHVLESIDRFSLKSRQNKAHHALLYAMALDKNYIDVTDDSIAQVAVDYYQKHGSHRDHARALYYLGIVYFNRQEYDKAILEFSKAENLAEDSDSLYLGMIYQAQSYTYNCTYNSIAELNYARKAFDVFTAIDAEKYIRSSLFRLAISYQNMNYYDQAIEQYKSLIENTVSLDYYCEQSLLNLSHVMIEMPEVNYEEVVSQFRKSRYEYGTDFEEKDYWAWAYSLYRLGCDVEADQVISLIEVKDEMIANFWKSRIAALHGYYKDAYEYDAQVVDSQNRVVRSTLEESLASYQRDYYQARSESAEYRFKMQKAIIHAIIMLFILFIVILLLAASRYVNKQKEEKEKYLQYMDEVRHQLSVSESENYSHLKKRYLSLYKTRFEAVVMLFEQYLMVQGRTDVESLMFRKVMKLIDEIRNDSSNRVAFEKMLDSDLDNIMTNIRKEMPKLKESDLSIFSYLIVGFDATTISNLLDMSVNNIYAHKRRLKLKIQERNPEHAAQFLEMLS